STIKMYLNQLPDLCLLNILWYLKLKHQLRIITVCSRWNRLLHHLFLLRKSLTLAIGPVIPVRMLQDNVFNYHSLKVMRDLRFVEEKTRFCLPLFDINQSDWLS